VLFRSGFIHLTFEEALAAYGLVSAGQIDPQKSLHYIQAHLHDPAWRETILLSVGVRGLINRQPRAAGEMVRAILKMDCDEENPGENILLAGACLEDVGENGLGQSAARDVQAALLTACHDRSLPPKETSRVILEENVWIGDSAIVCKGVTIGKNSIIGAGSVVTSDIPANVTAAGNPARVIRPLDSEQQIITRKDRFSDTKAMNLALESAEKEILQGNTFWGWVRSFFFPEKQA